MRLAKSVAAAAISIILAVFMLTGCTAIPADISDLEIPPKLTAEQQAIETALENKTGGKLTLKFPLEGDYRSAFVFRDLDHSGKQQVLAFYTPSSGTSGPHIAILDKVNNKWQITNDIGSEGTEIDSIAFGDFNGDGNDEIAVGWRSYTNTDLTLVVYTKKGSGYTKVNLGTFTEMKTLDMTGDGRPDIILLQLDSDVAKAKATLISYKNGKLEQISSSPLDSTVTSYAGVYVTKLKGDKDGILVDGYKSNNKMITELVYYSGAGGSGRLVSPLYDKNKHTVNSTLRYVNYKCADIDGDGTVEIPMPVELPPEPDKNSANQNWLVRWSVFDGIAGLTTKLSAIMNYTEDYYVTYPQKWETKKVTVLKHNKDKVWDFCKWNATGKTYGKVLFTISVYSEDEWNGKINKDSDIKLAEVNGTVYAAEIPPQLKNEPLSLSPAEIKSCFHILSSHQ